MTICRVFLYFVDKCVSAGYATKNYLGKDGYSVKESVCVLFNL